MTTSPKDYWGYMIDQQEKRPSPRLEQLLLGIAHYTIKHLEPRDHHVLTPAKLSNFYHAVGGDLDALFMETPPASLSSIYSTLGCFHSLQPSQDPHEAPSIPALTTIGFVKWQTIQILLEPDEHVAYLQEAVRKFPIPNKGDGGVLGSIFPPNLPRECFPAKPDESTCRWHDLTLQRMKREAQAERVGPRPSMQRNYSSTTGADESDEEEAAAAAAAAATAGAGGAGGNYFVSKLRDKIQQHLGNSRPASKDSRDSRERRHRYRDFDDDRDLPPPRRRRSLDGRGAYYTSPSSDEIPRRSRGHRPPTGSSYDSAGSPASPESPAFQGPTRRGDRAYAGRGRGRDGDRERDRNRDRDHRNRDHDRDRDWDRIRDRDRERERDRDRDREAFGGPSPPSIRLKRPTPDSYGRRHSAHYPHSTLDPDDEPPRARSRSHDRNGGGSSNKNGFGNGNGADMLRGRSARGRLYGNGARPTTEYIVTPPPQPQQQPPPPLGTTSSTTGTDSPRMAPDGIVPPPPQPQPQAQPPPPPSNFARGKLRHTVHSPGVSPYRSRRRDEERPPPDFERSPNRRMEEGWSYM